ncbi:MAG: MBL fold metallo-hydrolase [Ruminococcaceae bacterium]|nr:MBL fold metallo-hydrolase [Oscillospiraceae bacterium]
MKDYTLQILYSGSDGNAALLRAGDTAILIDAGRNAKALTAALRAASVDPTSLSAIFLTHEHRDHTAALDVFLKHYPLPVHTVFACGAQLRACASAALLENLVEHPPCFEVNVGSITLTSFPTSHDSAGSVGYRITVTSDKKTHTVGYVTDLGTVTPTVEKGLLGCEAVVIEANHDTEMLRQGPYPYPLKQRIASRFGHLSNTDCAALCVKLATHGTNRFLLAHLSETNNLPDLALSEVGAALAGFSVTLNAADPIAITEL